MIILIVGIVVAILIASAIKKSAKTAGKIAAHPFKAPARASETLRAAGWGWSPKTEARVKLIAAVIILVVIAILVLR